MVRPRRGEGVPANKRLENAFWDMFAEMSFDDITVSSISKRAEVNHNTFYYYFDNLDSMASQMIEQNLISDMPLLVLSGFSTGTFDLDQIMASQDARQKFQRICILAGPNSASWMRDKLMDAVYNLWMKSIGINTFDLTRDEKIIFTFAIGGLLAVLGEHAQSGDPSELKIILESDLGRGLISTIANLLNDHRERQDDC